MALIDLKGVSRVYRRGGEEVYALRDFDLQLEKGTFTAIMGPSGSGKSTVLNLIGGLDRADTGEVWVDGDRLDDLSNNALAGFRADSIGFVFQGFNLLPVLTALQNVELPLLLAPLSRAERRKHALYALKLVGLEDRVHHRPRELSGGQEQRVAIARALATDPKLILADEPTGDLDRASADAVLDLLKRLNTEHEKTIIMVTHDPKAAAHAQQMVLLDKGGLERIVDNRAAAPKQEQEPATGEDAPATPPTGEPAPATPPTGEPAQGQS
jgi:putative ABC transport system ATP-binding protein